VDAGCPNFEHKWDVNNRSRRDRLPQLTSDDGGSQLPLRMKLAKRASLRVVVAVETIHDSQRNGAWFRNQAAARGGDRGAFVLAPHQLMQTLAKQHHPRIEDEHAACKNWLQAWEHGLRKLLIQHHNTCN
jgi:hypothetical protein